jgi:hypothetical protein
MGGGADHDDAGLDAGGVLSHHPPAHAVARGVPQDLPLSRHVVGGQQVQLVPDQGPGGLQVLSVRGRFTRGDVFLRVHHVHRAAVSRGQPGRGLGDQGGHGRVVNGGDDHARSLIPGYRVAHRQQPWRGGSR